MFIDTHCHISDEYYDDFSKIYYENKKVGVKLMIMSLCTKEEMNNSIKFIDLFDDVYATIGFHPEEANIVTDDDIVVMEKTILSNKKIIGIGEIGLDYHYGKENVLKQQEIFEKQLCLAEKLNLPVVIHTRDATKDTIDILKKHNVKAIIHCFSGSLETAKIYVSMGFKLGIGGVLTFKNSKLLEVVKELSLDNIVLETDSPYLTPTPYRGKVNSSKYIPIIAEKIAQIKNVDVLEISEKTIENTYNVFDLK